jgi:hypothetical protein
VKSNILAGKKSKIPRRAAASILQQGTVEIKHKYGGVIYQIISCFENVNCEKLAIAIRFSSTLIVPIGTVT